MRKGGADGAPPKMPTSQAVSRKRGEENVEKYGIARVCGRRGCVRDGANWRGAGRDARVGAHSSLSKQSDAQFSSRFQVGAGLREVGLFQLNP